MSWHHSDMPQVQSSSNPVVGLLHNVHTKISSRAQHLGLRRFTARLTTLSISGLLASGSTFLLFVLVTRSANPRTVGQFALALALSQATVQFIDAGYGPLIVREALRHSAPGAVLVSAFKRRLRFLFVAQIVVALGLCIMGLSVRNIVAVEWFISASAGYGFLVIACQATRRFHILSALQLLNALTFIGFGALVSFVFAPLALSVAVGAAALALTVVDLVGFTIFAPIFRREEAPIKVGTENRMLLSASIANTVTGSVDSWVVGFTSPALLAIYAANQRPAFLLLVISNSLTALALPTLANVGPAVHRRIARWSRLLALFAPIAGVAAAGIGAVLLPLLYGSASLVRPPIVGILIAAYLLGMLTNGTSATLVSIRRVDVILTAALVQVTITVAGVVLAMAIHSLVLVAVTLVFGRLIVLLIQAAGVEAGVELRSEPQRDAVSA